MKRISILIVVVSTFIVGLARAQEVYHGESFELNSPLSPNQSIEYKANDFIHLKKGFQSLPQSPNYAMMEIDPYFNPETPYGNMFGQPSDCSIKGRFGIYPLSFDVNENGAAIISMPLEFPEGINGMTPHLSLNYNSQGGNGILGLGWSLGGMSKISRVPYTYMYNDDCHAVQFSNTDELSIDGIVLRQGSKNGVACYYPEIYDYSIVYPINSNGSIDNGFRVLKKDGNVYTYDAKYYLQESITTPIEWHLSKVEDPFGNYIEYEYENDRNNGAFYPTSIRYTGHTGMSPMYEIRFVYASDYRNDCPPKYFSRPDSPNNRNGFSRITKKLETVECWYEDHKIISYKLTYVPLDWNIRALSYVEKQFFNDNGAKWADNLLIPTEFKWKETDYQLHYETAAENVSLDADYNADDQWFQYTAFAARFEQNNLSGLPKYEQDIVHLMKKNEDESEPPFYRLKVFHSDNVILEDQQHYRYDEAGETYDCSSLNNMIDGSFLDGRRILAFLPADTDGDGLNEIVCASYYRIQNEVRITIIKPAGHTFMETPAIRTYNCPNHNSSDFSDFSIADFNGDGLSDLFFMFTNKPWVLISSQNNPFSWATFHDMNYGSDHYRRIVIGDFNGDKKDQIIIVAKHTSNNNPFAHHLRIVETNMGLQFSAPQSITDSIPSNYYNSGNCYRLCTGDFNGDGKSDIVLLCQDKWRFYFSKGNGVFSDAITHQDYSNDTFVTTYENQTGGMAYVFVTDLDYDGCDDISFIKVNLIHSGTYAGAFRRDFLIRATKDNLLVRRIRKQRTSNGNDVCIDSIARNGDYYAAFIPFLPILGNHKGTAPNEIMTCRMGYRNGFNNLGVFLHNTGCLDNPPVRAIDTIVTSLGAETAIEYRPVSYQFLQNEDSGRGNERMEEDSRDLTPVLPYNGYMNIVEKVMTEMNDTEATGSSSPKTFRKTRYHFSRPYYHTRGRGFLGFKWIWSRQQGQNNCDDIITAQTYSLNEAYSILVPESKLSKHFNSSSGTATDIHQETSFTYDFHTSQDFHGDLGQIPNDVFSPYLEETTTKTNFGHIMYEKDIYERNDGYGNITKHEHLYGFNEYTYPYFERDSTTFENNAGSNRWIIGVPKSEYLVQRLCDINNLIVYRNTDYENNMNTGLHTEKRTEPGNEKQLTETYAYDGFGNLISTVSIGSGKTRTESALYSEDGRLLKTKTNALGQTTSYTYDEALGRMESTTDPNGLTTRYYYDILGNLIQTEYPSGVSENQSVMWVSYSQNQNYHPDTPNFGRPIYFTYSKRSGERESYVFYDQHNRKLREVSCNMAGEKIYVDYQYYGTSGLLRYKSAPYFAGSGNTPQFTEYSYDYLGRNTKAERPDGSVMRHVYSNGKENVYGFDGLHTEITFNAMGFVQKTKVFGGTNNPEVNFIYCGDGKLYLSTCDINNNSTCISYAYDINRNPLSITDPSLGELTYDYNAFGELVGSTTPNDETSYTYDALGRMTQRNGSDGNSYWTYDNGFIGALSSTNYVPINGPTVKESFQYDRLGQLTRQTQKVGNEEEWAYNYTYNSLGKQSSITYPSGKKVKYHYNSKGFMDYVKDAATGDVLWQANASDRWDNISSFSEGDIDVEYNYDPVTGLVNSIGATRNNQTLLDQAYHWTTTGNLDWRTDATLDLKESLGYDAFNRLTSAVGEKPSTNENYFSHSFDYDSYGNITEKTGVGNYAYGTNASPYAITGLQPETGQEALFNHQEATYTSFDKLSTLSQDGKTLSVNYGIDRQRVMQTFSDGTTTRTKRYFTPLYETVTENGVTKKLHYLTSSTGLFAIFASYNNGGGTMHYTLKDHLGNLTATISGNTVERLSYDAWGRRRNPIGFGYSNVTHTFDRGYTLHEHYDDFDLINMNGRLYDPVLGRMLSPDIAIQDEYNAQAYNRYSYCFNNPLRFTDPSGYFVTIPPEYFEIEEYIRYNDVESLRQIGVTNYNSSTELSEGKLTTTTTWTCDGRDVEMITRTQLFPFYEQHFSKSCLAVSVVAQEISNGAGFDNMMSIIQEISNMVLFQPNAFEKGLEGDDFLEKYTQGFSCTFSSSYPHSASILESNLDYLLSEFDKGSGIGFTVKNQNWIGNHFVNMYSYSKLYENNTYQDYKIKVWDSDFYNHGSCGGLRGLDDYHNLLKINVLMK